MGALSQVRLGSICSRVRRLSAYRITIRRPEYEGRGAKSHGSYESLFGFHRALTRFKWIRRAAASRGRPFVLLDPATRAPSFIVPLAEFVLIISEPLTLRLTTLLEESDGETP